MSNQDKNIPAMFFDRAARGKGSPRYMTKDGGGYRTVSWQECCTAVEEIAAGLIDGGLRPGDRVAILSSTRAEWMEADLGALSAGAVTIPVYPSNLPNECGYILVNSNARTVFVENAAQAAKILKVQSEGIDVEGEHFSVPVDRIIIIEGTAEGCTPLSELRGTGASRVEELRGEIQSRTDALGRDDLATIVYTSGTTGLPKGVIQTHGNHLAAMEAVDALGTMEAGQVDFAFLPLAHSFGRMLEYMGIYAGTVTAFAESIEKLMDNIGEAKPHLLPSVPRIFEKVYAGVMQKRESGSAVEKAIFDTAVSIGSMRAEYANRGEAVPFWLAPLDAAAHALVFSKIHDRLGGRVRYLLSGGAPLSPEINHFFHAVGLRIFEGYGLTETTPILTCNQPTDCRIGTVGKVIPGVTLKIAADGEILAKGPNVTSGYYEREEETREAWDEEGWFHTGDIGELEDGYLRITDRKKELIKTAGGKYVAPQKIENMLKVRPYISQGVVIGDRLKYCVALITVDPDTLEGFAAEHGLVGKTPQEIAQSDAMRKVVEGEVAEVNKELASFESIKYFHILPNDFTVETGELTPSLKLKRKVIAAKYDAEIAAMT